MSETAKYYREQRDMLPVAAQQGTGTGQPEPLPCPFCGEKPEIEHYAFDGVDGERWAWYVICATKNCPVRLVTRGQDTREEAIALWNQRAK